MDKSQNVVIGKFSGKCADGSVFNNNQMKLSGELFRNLLASEDYQTAIANRWYIGFLGHPEDPNCMDFKNACIVMTSCSIDENDEVFGEFDLLDTPVGRVVKTLQEAGVTFGISIRGAGDIDANGEVDPETFVFRGYDLVTFPAYNDAIPTFQKVAAATNVEDKVKYKKVCAAVKANLSSITSCEAIDIIQAQFSKFSDEYAAMEDRKNALKQNDSDSNNGSEVDKDDSEDIKLLEQKLEGMTSLYLDAVQANEELSNRVKSLQDSLATEKQSGVEAKRKLFVVRRVYASQSQRMKSSLAEYETKNASIMAANKELKSENLKYTRKIEATSKLLSDKDSIISRLHAEIRETVTASKNIEDRTSNLDAEIKSYQKQLSEAAKKLKSFQRAYASVMASAVGVRLDSIKITSDTSVEDIQNAVYGSTSTSNMSSVFVEPNVVDIVDSEEEDEENIVIL